MNKLFILIVGLVLVGFSALIIPQIANRAYREVEEFEECPFCMAEVINSQKIYEDDWIVAMLTYKPIVEGHVLVIPKRHVECYEMLTSKEVLQVHEIIKKVHDISQKKHDSSSYLVMQKNGKEVRQTVPHVHFHYIPRKAEESTLALFGKFLLEPLKRPIDMELLEKEARSYRKEFGRARKGLAQI